MKILPSLFCAALSAAAISSTCHAAGPIGKPSIVDASYLDLQKIPLAGRLVRAYFIQDEEGLHVLTLSRKEGPSQDKPHRGGIERVDLTAAFYTHVSPQNWTQEWTVRDHTDCPGLDLSVQFFSKYVTFTDLNEDGRVEVTVPYRMFCGGGIDSYLVKVILREGATKLAIRGKSRVRLGSDAFGGEHTHDPLLLTPAFAAHKAHMDKVWKRVSDDEG